VTDHSWLDFGSDPDDDADTGIFLQVFLSFDDCRTGAIIVYEFGW